MGSTSGSSSTASGSSDQIKNDIQTAFRNEPTLTSSSVAVNVTDDSIELSGSAPSAKDRDEAKRIAQSFAGNRRVVDNIKVAGSDTGSSAASPNSSSSTTGTSPNSSSTPNSGSSTSTSPNSSTNPEQPNVPKKKQ
jgi:hypothetical protein